MDLRAELDAACSPDELFALVADLGRYPEWLSIVARCDPADEPGAWFVELRGRLGPMSRSKRLRMARTDVVVGRSVRFERAENDRRDHSPWILAAQVSGDGDGSRLVMDLHYGGSFGGRVLRHMLEEEIERSRPRLRALAEGHTAG